MPTADHFDKCEQFISTSHSISECLLQIEKTVITFSGKNFAKKKI